MENMLHLVSLYVPSICWWINKVSVCDLSNNLEGFAVSIFFYGIIVKKYNLSFTNFLVLVCLETSKELSVREFDQLNLCVNFGIYFRLVLLHLNDLLLSLV